MACGLQRVDEPLEFSFLVVVARALACEDGPSLNGGEVASDEGGVEAAH